jgi:hypothetical protein
LYFRQFWHWFHLVINLILYITWILNQAWFVHNFSIGFLLISWSQMTFIQSISFLPVWLCIILNYILIIQHLQTLIMPQIINFYLFTWNVIFLLNAISHRKRLFMLWSELFLVDTAIAVASANVFGVVLVWVFDLVLGFDEILRVFEGITALHTV